VAEDCAIGLDSCRQTPATATADFLADLNADDGAAAIGSLVIDKEAQTVRVDTHTETATGGTEFEPFFMQVLGMDGTRVAADATARWGSVAKAVVLPLAISDCEYRLWWDDPTLSHSYECSDNESNTCGPRATIYLHGTGPEPVATCGHRIPGFDPNGDGFLPAGFGWLNTGSEACSTGPEKADDQDPYDDPNWDEFYFPGEGGAAPPQDCRDDIADALDGPVVVLIPYFGSTCRIGEDKLQQDPETGEMIVVGRVTEEDCPLQNSSLTCSPYLHEGELTYRPCSDLPAGVNAQSNNRYFIIGFGAFVLETYRLPGLIHPDNTCLPGEFCLQGRFTSRTITEGEFDDDKPMGLILIRLID
jgi:hypothetical protein